MDHRNSALSAITDGSRPGDGSVPWFSTGTDPTASAATAITNFEDNGQLALQDEPRSPGVDSFDPDDEYEAPRLKQSVTAWLRDANERQATDFDDAPTSVRVAIFGTLCAVVTWIIFSLFILAATSLIYAGPTIDGDRQRYALVAARRMATACSHILNSAFLVRDSVVYAVERKLYFDPMDYEAARRFFAPSFAALPALRALDLAFTNQTFSLSLRKILDGTGVPPGSSQGVEPISVLLQTDAPNCLHDLGPLGCLRSGRATETPWFANGARLYGGLENPAATVADMSQWLKSPSFVPRMVVETDAEASPIASDTTTTTEQDRWWESGDALATPRGYVLESADVAWEMASTLIFRVPFPGSRGYLSLIGRVTLELSAVRAAGRLVDEKGLGKKGVVLLLDVHGHILGAAGPGAQAVFVSGDLRPRKVWQFDAPWASHTEEYLFAGKEGKEGEEGTQNHFTFGGYFVAIETIPGKGLEVFKVLVAAERDPFKDSYLLYVGEIAQYVLVWLPIPGCILIIIIYLMVLRYRRWRKLKRVVPARVESDDSNRRQSLSSISQAPMLTNS